MEKEYYKLLKDIALIPSYSYEEDKIHDFIRDYVFENFKNTSIRLLPDHSMVIIIEGNKYTKPVAICSHLDKINHFSMYRSYHKLNKYLQEENGDLKDLHTLTDSDPADVLPYYEDGDIVKGVMDNSIGVSLCLQLAKTLKEEPHCPPIYLLLSAQEEVGMGGAKTISEYLLDGLSDLPEMFITIDTCPRCVSNRGVALYRNHFDPDGTIKSWFLNENKNLLISEGATDYLVYSRYFTDRFDIPSIAIEPAVTNMHSLSEIVFKDDIDMAYNLIKKYILE